MPRKGHRCYSIRPSERFPPSVGSILASSVWKRLARGGIIRIVALSGPIAAGKSALSAGLQRRYPGVHVFKTHEVIREMSTVAPDRAPLQRAGARLDRETRGRWLKDALARAIHGGGIPNGTSMVIVDSCRIEGQVDGLREVFHGNVVHMHITAPLTVLEKRYLNRDSKLTELKSYAEVRSDPTEAQVEELGGIADIVIDTARCTPEDVQVRAAGQLGFYGRGFAPLVDVLVGGQWGSEGKGHIASYLAPEYDVLVRVGGPNAGHKVYRSDGAITYHHLPSGSGECDAKVVLGPGTVLREEDLLDEIAHAERTRDDLFIDPQAMIIEDSDIAWENKDGDQIGSTKRGVGRATSRKVLRWGTRPGVRLANDVTSLKPFVTETCAVLDDAFRAGQTVFLEGTQGTGLSLHHGSFPHVTSRETSVSGCLAEAGIAPGRVRKTIMLIRTYPIRVAGTSGPMGLEINWAEVARRSRQDPRALRAHEHTSTTKKLRRVAEFSWSQLRRSSSLNGPTDVALSFVDYIDKKNEKARRFEQLTEETIQLIEDIERVATAPVSLIVTRFKHPDRSIIDRRKWGGR